MPCLFRCPREDSFEWGEGGVDDPHQGPGDERVEVHVGVQGEREELEWPAQVLDKRGRISLKGDDDDDDVFVQYSSVQEKNEVE